MQDSYIYCPVCGRYIAPTNSEDQNGFVYVHDDIEHDDSDIEALEH